MIKKIIPHLVSWLLILVLLLSIFFMTGSSIAGMCLAVWLLFPFLSCGMNFPVRKKLKVKFRNPAVMSKGKETSVDLEVRNHSWIPVSQLFCRISVYNQLTGETADKWLEMPVASKGTVQKALKIGSATCGYLKLSVSGVYLTDWAGFLPVRCRAGASGRISVVPDTFAPHVIVQPAAARRDEADAWEQGKKGNDPAEISALRDYAEGDSLRQIHWKLSAKKQQLIVREPSLPVEKSLLLFWDKNAAPADAQEMDAMAECVASVAQEIAHQGIVFTLGWTEGSRNVYEEIHGEEDCLRVIPGMLKWGAELSGSMEEYDVPLQGQYSFGKTVYFGKTVPENSPVLQEGEITFVVCDKKAAHPVWPVITWTAQNYAEELEILEL